MDTVASPGSQLVKAGQGEWVFNGSNTGGSGSASVTGGLFTVNGDLSNFTVAIANGARLGGSGSVGSVNVATGGRLGSTTKDVLSVKGNLAFEQGAVLYVNVDADGNTGRVDVSQKITLNNTPLQVLLDTGSYASSTRYTILTAASGITGVFVPVDDLYFLTPKLYYTGQSVELELNRNRLSITSAAQNPSAVNVAQVLGEQTPVLLGHLLNSNADNASRGLDQLAGAAAASRAAAMLANTTLVGNVMLDAMGQLNEVGNGLQASLLRNDGPLLVATPAPSDARGLHDPNAAGRLWVQALGSRGDINGTHRVSDLSQQTSGLLVGMDWSANPAWRIGVVGGYSKTHLDASHLEDRINSYHLGGYARHQDGALVTRMGLAYSGHTGASKREIDFTGYRDTPKASYDASNQHAFVEFALPNSSGMLIKEPFASLAYQRYNREAYDEKGGAAALHVDDQQQSNLLSTLGLRIARQSTLDNGMTLTRRAALGWRHTYGNTDLSVRQAFLSGGSAFEVYGSALDRNSGMVQAGVDLGISADQNLALNYAGELGRNNRLHGLAAEWRLSF